MSLDFIDPSPDCSLDAFVKLLPEERKRILMRAANKGNCEAVREAYEELGGAQWILYAGNKIAAYGTWDVVPTREEVLAAAAKYNKLPYLVFRVRSDDDSIAFAFATV